ncbi:MAG: oligosaccharide flippase family protein [Chthonomonadales bacterium]|nr:oligosaccharide flippase family protein [Chthonomonadales bacterium]
MTISSSDTAAVRPALQPLSLRRSFSWTLAANAVTALANVAILSALAQLGSAAIVGQYTLGVTLGTMIHALPQLSLRAVQSTDARDRYLFSEYLGLRLIGVAVGALAVAAAAVLGGYRPDTALVVVLVGVYMGVTGVADIVYGLLQRHEQHNRMALSMIVKAALSVIVVAAAMAVTHSVAVACVALTVSAAAVCALYDFPSARFVLGHRAPEATGPGRGGEAAALAPSFDPARMWSLTWLALPLGIANALNLIYFYAARLVIVRYHGEADLGIFSASAQLAAAGYLVTAALAMATGPRMARLYAERRWKAFTSVLVKFLAVSTVLGAATLLVGFLMGGPLLRILYTPEYARQPAVLLWLLGAAAINFVSTCFGTSLTVSRQFGVQLTLGIVSVATTLLVSIWLVPRIGLVGGGIAAAATSAVRLVGLGTVFLATFARVRRADMPADAAPASAEGENLV